ncbi:MAG: SMC-Scp complex subunit ScpB [Clostridiales bacterium]|nr:SMC-Scp complex subunit ScpB [Clostridiales bacterium]
MGKDEVKSIIEALLFAWSEPITSKEISKVLSMDTKEVDKILNEMVVEFYVNKRGIQIIKMNNHYQLSTKPEYYTYIKKLLEPKENKHLSQAALETLAIIAYKQPITKVEIEEIRGVKCDKALATLQEKELIEQQGRLDKIGRPIVYGTSLKFLKVFNLESLDDLPKIEDGNLTLDREVLK